MSSNKEKVWSSKGNICRGVSLFAIGAVAATLSSVAAVAGPKIEFIDPMASALGQNGHDLSPVGMFEAADGVVQTVIIVLILASVITWTIGVAKWVELRGERRRLGKATYKLMLAADFGSVGETGYAPLADMLVNAEDEIASSARSGKAMSADGVKNRISIRLERLEAVVRRRAGRSIGVLAIIGSSSPFVGLFGTVWGIMNSFIGIAHSHTTNLAVVAPGIAEALLTTAAGLVAAIPAGVLYNVFARTLAIYTGELGDAGAIVLCLAAREIDGAEAGN